MTTNIAADAAARISYTIPQAALAVGCSVDVIRAAVRTGQLTPRYITKALRVIRADELVAWVESAPTERTA